MAGKKPEPMTLAQVAEAGDRLETLRALRSTLAKALEYAEPQSIAALVRQMQAVLAEISELEKALGIPGRKSPRDEVAARRARRQAQAQ